MVHQTKSCKLPLLDGDTEASPQVITIDIASGSIGELQRLYSNDRSSFESYLYTAWALLLRCYTGQDHVCFRIRRPLRVSDGDASPPSSSRTGHLLQLALREDETLSDITRRVASDVIPISSQFRTTNAKGGNESASPLANTTVVIYYENHGQLPAAADAIENLEVSQITDSFNGADFCIRLKSSCSSIMQAIARGFQSSPEGPKRPLAISKASVAHSKGL